MTKINISQFNLVKPLLICVSVLSGAALISSSHAQSYNSNSDTFASKARGKWVIGAKATRIDNNIDRLDDSDGAGIVLGYEFNKPIGRFPGTSTIELEYIDGSETDVSPFPASLVGFISSASIINVDPDVVNLFYTYRSAGDFFYKFKLGASYSDVTFTALDDLGTFQVNSEDVSIAGGIGVGYRIGDYGVIELEYSGDTGVNELGLFSINALLTF